MTVDPGTAARPRRRGRPGHDIESVLAVAVRSFTERGFDRTSIDDLARELGVGKSAIYHHVGSKDALLGLALDRALDGLEAAITDVRALDAPAVERLEALVRGSVAVLLERLPYVTLLLRVRGNSDVERQALTRRRRIDRYVAELVAAAIDDGDLRPDVDPAVTARLLFGMVNSLTEWVRPGRRGTAASVDATLADTVASVAFDGLLRADRPTDRRTVSHAGPDAGPPAARRVTRLPDRRPDAAKRRL